MRKNDLVGLVRSLAHERDEGTHVTRKGGNQASFMEPLRQTLLVLKFSCLLLLLCRAGVSFGQTPQQQAWSILQGGLSDKKRLNKNASGARSGTSSRESESAGGC